MFAAFLGYNPVQHLLEPYGVLSKIPPRSAALLTGKHFFPELISGAFHHGLVIVFSTAALMAVIGALVSLMRGKQFYYDTSGRGGAGTPGAAALPADAGSPDAMASREAGLASQSACPPGAAGSPDGARSPDAASYPGAAGSPGAASSPGAAGYPEGTTAPNGRGATAPHGDSRQRRG
jgi:hypothetical protein